MKAKILIAMTIAVCLAVGFSISTASPGDDVAVDNALKNVGYTMVRLRKTAFNEFEVNATLNGNKPITLLLSFHAVNTIFNTKRLDEAGVSYTKAGQDFEVNGDKDDLYVIRTDSISIGDGTIGPEELMAINFGEFEAFEDYRVTGILGRDFLIKYNAIIDFANQKLYLKTK